MFNNINYLICLIAVLNSQFVHPDEYNYQPMKNFSLNMTLNSGHNSIKNETNIGNSVTAEPEKPELSEEEKQKIVSQIQEKIKLLNVEKENASQELRELNKEYNFNKKNIFNHFINNVVTDFIDFIKKILSQEGLYESFILYSLNINNKNFLEEQDFVHKKADIDILVIYCYNTFINILHNIIDSEDKLTVIKNILKDVMEKYNIILLKEQFDYKEKNLQNDELLEFVTKYCDDENDYKKYECVCEIANFILRYLNRSINEYISTTYNSENEPKIKSVFKDMSDLANNAIELENKIGKDYDIKKEDVVSEINNLKNQEEGLSNEINREK